jgi:hypothetical protein
VGILWLQEDDRKLHKDVLILLSASIVASGGERRRATSVTRVQRVSSFAGKNPHHGGLFIGVFDRIIDCKNSNTFLV